MTATEQMPPTQAGPNAIYSTSSGRRIVWKATPFWGGETRWARAIYDTCAGVIISWRVQETEPPEGWYPIDTDAVMWIADPDPDGPPRRRRCWLRVTRGGRVISIAIPDSSS